MKAFAPKKHLLSISYAIHMLNTWLEREKHRSSLSGYLAVALQFCFVLFFFPLIIDILFTFTAIAIRHSPSTYGAK